MIIDDNFQNFYKDLLSLDIEEGCLVNFYKNSLIDFDFLKKIHPYYSKKFIGNIKKINKKYKFTNSIFKDYIWLSLNLLRIWFKPLAKKNEIFIKQGVKYLG